MSYYIVHINDFHAYFIAQAAFLPQALMRLRQPVRFFFSHHKVIPFP